ncbi:MAG: phosphoribosylformylglycinamidine cyclo-ligase [Planctomycetes bacterium]|nr:phosphoribosylformylglycinamidine cyclo-ligase [Planctomycetota bacterium]
MAKKTSGGAKAAARRPAAASKKPAPKSKTSAPKPSAPKPSAPKKTPAASHAEAVVDLAGEASAMAGLLGWVRKTFEQRPAGTPGHVAVDVGYFASVVALGGNLGLAVSADGVGTKLLVAQLLDRYDTVGIDLVAMNVNDLICVGAEPLTLLDYIAVERLDGKMLTALGKGLHDGAAQAGVTISGGELAQIGAMLRGARPGRAFDVAAVAVGTVPLDRVCTGQDVREGDVVVGLASSGIHSNGLTLARRALLDDAGLSPGDPLPGARGVTVGDALLEPTRIYVRPVLELLKDPRGAQVTALAHITGGGFLNMTRIAAPCGYVLDALPRVPPIFTAIAEAGAVGPAEMWAAYNMGVGFTITLRPGGEERALEVARAHGIPAWVIGRAVTSEQRRITLPGVGLESDDEGDVFRPIGAPG